MKKRKLLISILTGLCVCLMGTTLFSGCKDDEGISSSIENTQTESSLLESNNEASSSSEIDSSIEDSSILDSSIDSSVEDSSANNSSSEDSLVDSSEDSSSDSSIDSSEDSSSDSSMDSSDDSSSDSTEPAPHEHDFTLEVIENAYLKAEATCESKAVYYYACACGEQGETTFEYGAVLGHDVEQHDAQAATCTAIGWNAYETCARCDYTTYVELPALTHDKVQHDAQAATCTEKGWEGYETCSRCDYTTYVEIPATGEHSWNDGEITTQPTCTDKGVKTFTCTVCTTTTYTEEVSENAHNHKGVTTAPTCTTQGYTTYTCTACDDTYVADYTSALGHNDGEIIVENAMNNTCTLGGSYDNVVYCTVCKEELSRETVTVPALGHTEVMDKAVSPTCTQTGSTEGKHCSICKEVLIAQELLPAFGHTDGEIVVENVTNNTCTTNGSYDNVVYCTVCNAEVSRETITVNKLGHDEKSHEAKAETCTEKGWNAYETCSRCDYTTYVEIPATGHTYSEQNPDEQYLCTEATTESPATYYYSCACGEKGEETFYYGEVLYIPTESVTLSVMEGIINVGTSGSIQATVLPTNASNKTLTWTTSNPTVATVENGLVTALTEGVTTITATTVDGKTASCVVYVIIPIENVTINQATAEIYIGQPFSLTATVTPANATYPTIAWTSSDETVATVNENGVITAKQAGQTIITATAYDGQTATCTLTVKAGEIEFTLTDDCSFYYVSGYTGYETHVEIPNLHDGLRIIRIAESAFRGNTYIETITLPNSIQIVDAYAFYGCTSLKTVNIPESVKDLNEYTFANCTSLETVTLNYKITKIGAHAFENCASLTQIIFLTNGVINLEIIDEYAFANCTSLANFHAVEVLPKLKIVGAYAFSKCTTLELVSLPTSVQTIDTRAFEYCTGLKYLYVGNNEDENVTATATIGTYAFTHCTAMEYAVITGIVNTISNNAFEYCTAMQKVYFSEGLTTIKDRAFDYCTALKAIDLPDTLTTIGNMAFRHAESLTYIEFPTQLQTIGNACFQYCISLSEVTLPENITKLGSSAFSYCEGLTSLTVLGNVTDWGNSTFYECQKLTGIYIASAGIDTLEEENYVFYNAGIAGDGITLTIGKTAVIPERLFLPVESGDCVPAITEIIVEDGATTVDAFLYYNYLPYLTNITLPDGVTNMPYGIFNNSPWWIAQEKGAVYINNIFYGYKCECDYCSPSEIIVENYVDSDCLTDGIYQNVVTCTVCGYEVLRQDMVIPAKGHDYVSHEAQEETCTTVGWEAYNTCSRCDYTEYEEIPALGHDYVPHEAQAETCLEIGWEEYNTCSRCDYNEYEEIPALGHDYIPHEAQAVTCLEIGWNAYNTCSRCDYNEYVEIPTLGHKVLGAVEQEVVNYTTQNDTQYPFSISGNQITSTNTKDSSSSTYTIIAQRAFTLELQYKVSSESNYDYLTIKHNSTEKVKTSGTTTTTFTALTISMNAGDKVTITYSKDSSQKKGSDCAWVKIITASIETTIIETQLDATEENIAPLLTCTQAVLCAVCNGVVAEELGHDYIYHEAQSVTCTEIGWEAYNTCSRCDYTEYEEIPAGHDYIHHEYKAPTCVIGWEAYDTCSRCDYTTYVELPIAVDTHDVQNGYCINCNRPESTAGLAYSQNSDGTYTVTGIGTCTATNIVIGIYNNRNVTSIGSDAFYKCSRLTSVVIPDSVTSIGSDAFYDCDSLTSVVIGDSVTSIGDYAFYGCSSLRSVVIPDSVTTIGGEAFYFCSNLTSVVIGNSVTSIGYSAFGFCSRLTSIVIGDSVTWIGSWAFSGCSSLTSVVIGDSVTSISNSAFYNCSSLTSVVIPDSVTSIGFWACSGCSSLTSVYYQGTASDWSKISIDSYNTELTNATRYYYSEIKPAVSGNYWYYDENGNVAIW